MEINNVHVAYFSATYTTRTVVREIAARMGGNIVEHDITGPGGNVGPVALGEGDVMVAGVPVYAGRVPQAAAERLRQKAAMGRGGQMAPARERTFRQSPPRRPK